MTHKIVILPGDGIGPEVAAAARAALEAVAPAHGLSLAFESHDIGGCAIDAHGDPFPESTAKACAGADAAPARTRPCRARAGVTVIHRVNRVRARTARAAAARKTVNRYMGRGEMRRPGPSGEPGPSARRDEGSAG